MPLSIYVDGVVMLLGVNEAPAGALVHHRDACLDQADHPGVASSAGANERDSSVTFADLVAGPAAEGEWRRWYLDQADLNSC